MAGNQTWPEWLLESEAAEYCRCSLWSFRKMGAPAKNSGGRKVYKRTTLDAFLEGRDWQRSYTRAEPQLTDLPYRLTATRLRPYKPRKKPVSDIVETAPE